MRECHQNKPRGPRFQAPAAPDPASGDSCRNLALDGAPEPYLDHMRRQPAGRVCHRHDATWREAVADRLASATKLKVQDGARRTAPSAKTSFATATPV